METKRTSFVLQKHYYRVVKELSDARAGILFISIFEYVNELEYDIKNDPELLSIFNAICGDIECEWAKLNPRTNKYHWNYKGGISPENKSIRNSAKMTYWRTRIFERDNYTCQKCRKIGGTLNAHHIKEFALHPDLRFNINNGITLCKVCHIKTHQKHG